MSYAPGDRVRTTVDSPSTIKNLPGAPAGSVGAITHHFPPKHGRPDGYGVLLDDDPSGLSTHYYADELTPDEGPAVSGAEHRPTGNIAG